MGNDVELALGQAKENEESLGYEMQLVLERTAVAEECLKKLQSQVRELKPVAPESVNQASAVPSLQPPPMTKPVEKQSVGPSAISTDLGAMFAKDNLTSFAYSRKALPIKADSRGRLPWESAWSGCHVDAVPFVQLHNQR